MFLLVYSWHVFTFLTFFQDFYKKTLGRKFQPETIMRNIVHNFVSLLWWFFSAFSIAVFH